MKVLVLGRGLIGTGCAATLAAHGHAGQNLSARSVMAGEASAPAADLMVFAHGKPVTVKGFAEVYDDLLASRTGPLGWVDAGVRAFSGS